MVNWTKRVEKAAGNLLRPGETVLAGLNVTQKRLEMGGAATGGVIAGGALGALAGRAWDKRQAEKGRSEEDKRPKASIEDLPSRDIGFPKGGALIAVTDQRLLLWEVSQLGKAKDLFYETPVADVVAVYDRDVDRKLLRGAPASRAILLVFKDQTAISLWALAQAPNGKWADAFVAAAQSVVGN